jgi:hypothetical protein
VQIVCGVGGVGVVLGLCVDGVQVVMCVGCVWVGVVCGWCV